MATTLPVATLRALLRKQESQRGLLIAFEGPDGAGKTTQRKLFKDWLKTEGHAVVTTKWNSSELIKPLIKARKAAHALGPEEFCLLHAADFRHRVYAEILPQIWAGRHVICDRFQYTGFARDVARGVSLDWILNVYRPMVWPDVTFYFDVSAETSGKRIAAERDPTFYEAGQDVTAIDDPHQSYQQFVERVIKEYRALAVIFNFITIDAEQSVYQQHKIIRQHFMAQTRQHWAENNIDAMLDWLGRHPAAVEAALAG